MRWRPLTTVHLHERVQNFPYLAKFGEHCWRCLGEVAWEELVTAVPEDCALCGPLPGGQDGDDGVDRLHRPLLLPPNVDAAGPQQHRSRRHIAAHMQSIVRGGWG